MSEALHLAESMSRLFADAHNGWLCPFTEAVAGLTPAQAAWVPAPGMNSIWALVGHIRIETEVVARRMQGLPVDYAALGGADGWPPPGRTDDTESWESDCQRAKLAQHSLTELVAALSEADLAKPVPAGGPPRWYTLHALAAHTQYHTGQILQLRRLQGSWEPLQWLPGVGG